MASPDHFPPPADSSLHRALARVNDAVERLERGPGLGDPDALGRELLDATQDLGSALADLMTVPTSGRDRT